MHVDHAELFAADKTFPVRPSWRERDPNWFQLTSPLDIDGVTVEGLRFRATAMTAKREASVTFQLEYHPPRRDLRGGPLARIEWRPVSPHNNKNVGPLDLRFRLQTGTHHHEFQMNWDHSASQVRRGKLALAVPIEPEPTFEEVVAIVSREFRLSPSKWITRPPWQDQWV